MRAPQGIVGNRARRQFAATRRRFEGSWAEAFVQQLKDVRVGEWTLIFGAELLWSVLPLLILLSSFANTRIDDDLSRHIGLDSRGANIVEGLFRGRPAHDILAVLTSLLFSFAGTIAVVGSIQLLYERAFDQDHRGWRNLPRLVVWVAVLIGVLVAQAAIDRPVRSAVGPVIQVFVRLGMATIFFWWTAHFLLAGRVPWRVLGRTAVVTALLWIALALVSSLYFSSVVVSDRREYGPIGVVFTFLTWFVLIGGVFALGAACGAVWHEREATPLGTAGDRSRREEDSRRTPVKPLGPVS